MYHTDDNTDYRLPITHSRFPFTFQPAYYVYVFCMFHFNTLKCEIDAWVYPNPGSIPATRISKSSYANESQK